MLKIGLDAMGGDFAPEAAVKGAAMAANELGSDSRIVLFGDEEKIRTLLQFCRPSESPASPMSICFGSSWVF